MPTTPTPNLGLTVPLPTEQVSLGPNDFQDIVSVLDAGPSGPVAVRTQEGALSALPNPTTVPLGTVYNCTDVDAMFYRNSAEAWDYIPVSTGAPVIGAVDMYVGTSDPVDPDGVTRWLVCDGRAVSRTTYATLFQRQGVNFGSGDGATTFNIPNMKQRFPYGATGPSVMGQAGGAVNHTHTVPGLDTPPVSIPGLNVPGLTIPALSFSGLSIPPLGVSVTVSVPNLALLGQVNGVAFEFTGGGGNSGVVYPSSPWGVSGVAEGAAASGGGSTAGGTTGGGTTAPSITGGGVTQGAIAPGGTTGGGVTGGSNPPYMALNFIVKVL